MPLLTDDPPPGLDTPGALDAHHPRVPARTVLLQHPEQPDDLAARLGCLRCVATRDGDDCFAFCGGRDARMEIQGEISRVFVNSCCFYRHLARCILASGVRWESHLLGRQAVPCV